MEIALRASITFLFLLVLTRGLRRRTLADMAPFEMILLVVVGDIVQQGIGDLSSVKVAVLEPSGRISFIQ